MGSYATKNLTSLVQSKDVQIIYDIKNFNQLSDILGAMLSLQITFVHPSDMTGGALSDP